MQPISKFVNLGIIKYRNSVVINLFTARITSKLMLAIARPWHLLRNGYQIATNIPANNLIFSRQVNRCVVDGVSAVLLAFFKLVL